MFASLARVNSTLDLSTSDVELRAVAVDPTINGTGTEDLEVELAGDRDPADGVRVANEDLVLLELFKDINRASKAKLRASSTYIDLVVSKANDSTSLQISRSLSGS